MHPIAKVSALGWAAVSVLFVSAEAYGDEPFKALLGRVIVGHCAANLCSWFSIERTDLVGANATGSLYRVAIKEWESTHPNGSYAQVTDRRQTGESQAYALCSKTMPALIFAAAGDKWSARILAPDRADAMTAANEGAYRMYWAACHGLVLDDPYRIGPRLASVLGYRTALRPGQDERALDRPEAALLW